VRRRRSTNRRTCRSPPQWVWSAHNKNRALVRCNSARFEVQFHLSRLDLGEIQEITDQSEQVFARGVDLSEVGNQRFLPEVLGCQAQRMYVVSTPEPICMDVARRRLRQLETWGTRQNTLGVILNRVLGHPARVARCVG
jgi:hypothetical protein